MFCLMLIMYYYCFINDTIFSTSSKAAFWMLLLRYN